MENEIVENFCAECKAYGDDWEMGPGNTPVQICDSCPLREVKTAHDQE